MEHCVPSLNQGQRLLAAIMVTDAVGFSARMSVDEEQTLQLIDRDLQLITRLCQQYEGTVLKTTGDGLLTYFVSAVQAVSCALEIQTQLVALADQADEPYLDHRIGIHLGDILVSAVDVMGNGVNIAARLQNYANPRGLCISQVIYDVVKARLELNATYLGPLRLKNIREPVPAFQVGLTPRTDPVSPSPFPHNDSLASNEPTQVVTVTPEALLETAIRGLKLNPQKLRIKKLLFALAKNAWENDPAVLAHFEMRQLLVALRQRYPTLPELKMQLTRIVAGLNRKATYTALAETIVIQLDPWYQGTPFPADSKAEIESTGLLTGWEEALTALHQGSDPMRIRKLLFCLVQNTWENDPKVLEAYPLERLLEETCQVTPTLKDLKYQLGRIVKRLNHKQPYMQVANDIMASLRPLYSQDGEATQLMSSGSSESKASREGATRIEPVVAQPDMTTLHTTLSAPMSPAPSSTDEPVVWSQAAHSRSNLYDLRLEIMRYANPLRAKILLYSCLNGPFSFERQHWTLLRGQTLEQLLRALFDYCPSFDDLESKLTIIAHCLDNSEENAQVAHTVAQAMKAYYPQMPTASTRSQPTDASGEGQAKSEETSRSQVLSQPSSSRSDLGGGCQ